MDFNCRIKRVRKALGLSQSEAAAKVDGEHSILSDYERGKFEPTIRNLVKICQALDCTPNDLIDIPPIGG